MCNPPKNPNTYQIKAHSEREDNLERHAEVVQRDAQVPENDFSSW